jgi:hypothetical protein
MNVHREVHIGLDVDPDGPERFEAPPLRGGAAMHSAMRMPQSMRGWLMSGSVALVALGGCATTSAAADTARAAEDRAIAYDEGAAPAPSTSASSGPTLARATVGLSCDGSAVPAARCPQCPQEPERHAVARGFSAAASRVRRCLPTLASDGGTLRVRAEFESAGVPTRIELPGASVGEREAQCLREALCGVRVPTFQRPVAVVRFEYEGSARSE